MGLYVVVALLCAAALPWSWRRSGRSWTRYVIGTGSPLVLAALLVVAVVSTVIALADADLAREVFTGGLLGSGITQFILLRRTQGDDLRQSDAGRPTPEG